MANTLVAMVLVFIFSCGGTPVKILDATLQPFTGGREQSASGIIVTIKIQTLRSSKVLQIDSLVIMGRSFPVSLRNPESGERADNFRKKDTLMIRISLDRKDDLIHNKNMTAFLKYRLHGKSRICDIPEFRKLKGKIYRNP